MTQSVKAWKLLCYEWKCPRCERYYTKAGPFDKPIDFRCHTCGLEFRVEREE
jgi:transposase-like protein